MTGPISFAFVAVACAVTLAGPAQTTRPSRSRAETAAARIIVRDVSGNPLRGVRVSISGPEEHDMLTDTQGMVPLGSLADGSYSVRFERDGFVPVEQTLTVRNGRATDDLEVAMRIGSGRIGSAANVRRSSMSTKASAKAPAGTGVTVSIPTFLDRHYIGRDPLRESVFSCTPTGTIRLLQLRDPIVEHAHADAEESVYVVAGDGAIHFGTETTAISPGALTMIPRGVPHAIERTGRKPLIVLSTLSGPPCRSTGTDIGR